MFENELLKKHLLESPTVRNRALVVAEWNMNFADNIALIGNYRFRPRDAAGTKFSIINNTFDPIDSGQFYAGATDSDITIDGGLNDDETPNIFKSNKEKEALLYSLEDCFGRFRPRSGINKLRYLSPDQFTHFSNEDMFARPRYYVANKNDKFKYWTSYRKEVSTINGGTLITTERGVASQPLNGFFYIDDAAPFVVYKDAVPANRIVVKMQTNVGNINLGPFTKNEQTITDPFFGEENKTVPVRWKIQYLSGTSWVDAVSFNENSVRNNGLPIVGTDGYVEIAYGLIIPEQYRSIFKYGGRLSSATLLPDEAIIGQAFLVTTSAEDQGTFHIWADDDAGYQQFVPQYGWSVKEEELSATTPYVTDLTNPESFVVPNSLVTEYREFQYIDGIRVVAETMNKFDSTLDIIEISPRLAADLSDKTESFTLTKPASDLGISGMPVGQLLASTGSLSIFDYDLAFSKTNSASIVAKYLTQNLQLKFYDVVANVLDPEVGQEFDFFIPQKTMYVDGFPESLVTDRDISITLRDLFFYFESIEAPELLIQGASLSYAVSTLLDSIGFSNYTFKRIPGEPDPIIPYFFIKPERSVADILNDLARSTQTTMFFDEYNNFVCMTKNYIMPSSEDRPVDMVFYGTKDYSKDGVVRNKDRQALLANIVDIASQENKIFNDGKISYSERYIRRSIASTDQQALSDRYKTYIYQPVELWSAGPSEELITQNGQSAAQSGYMLAALPLNSTLSSSVPSVVNHQVINNTLDFGEAIDLIARHQGYFFSNGEVIKYDAIEYAIPGLPIAEGGPNVWVTSSQEYERYFSKLPFNGKMYKTGLVRIYAEPEYETVDGVLRLKNGAVVKHGRGQFNTQIVAHNAGVSSHWTSNSSIRGIHMNSKYLFVPKEIFSLSSASSSGNVITVSDTTLVKVGQTVVITSDPSTGILSSRPKVTEVINKTTFRISETPQTALNNATIQLEIDASNFIQTTPGPAGQTTALGVSSNIEAIKTSRGSVIRNNKSLSFPREGDTKRLLSTQPGTIQASALVLTGRPFQSTERPIDFVSYVYKPLDAKYKHFGTRMRIVGKRVSNEDAAQSAAGEVKYYSNPDTSSGANQYVNISGSSGGMGVLINPATNNGYFMELIALNQYSGDSSLHDVVFYKVAKNQNSLEAVPVKLWGGSASIIVDTGEYAGQSRQLGSMASSVYDLAVEYVNIGTARRFFLYLNGKQIATVDDPSPLPVYNNMALFTRGQAKCMFENIYALANNYAYSTSFAIDAPLSSALSDVKLSASEALNKYAVSSAISSTYLSGISTSDAPEHSIYFEEFGSIMREVAHFDIKYDKAYPALLARIAPAPSSTVKTYTVSGFTASSYGAEFLVFNNTDTALVINSDNSKVPPLLIHGVAFTDESMKELTVDEYFAKTSDFSSPKFAGATLVSSPIKQKQAYQEIKFSRMTDGQSEFAIDAPYIQSTDDAYEMMSWLSGKIMKPRLAVGLEIFSTPTVQLGDIVQINYKNDDDQDQIISSSARFVVYNIEYSRSANGPAMKVYLSEVI